MATIRVQGPEILIDTDLLSATVHIEGYVSGVGAGTLLDKTTGARDLGFGLDIADFLLEPVADTAAATQPYHTGDLHHGSLTRRYVELPQICTQARKLPYELLQGEGYVGVRQWFRYREATYGRQAGSLWEQTIVFRDGQRYFLSEDRITSANDVAQLIFRLDMPGHLKHVQGDSFEQVYLSYQTFGPGHPATLPSSLPDCGTPVCGSAPSSGVSPHRRLQGDEDPATLPGSLPDCGTPVCGSAPSCGVSPHRRLWGDEDPERPSGQLLSAAAFLSDFAPDAAYLYQRGVCPAPERMIRAYQVRLGGRPGPWLAGMTLQPEAVSEAWCHQRGYVCFIEELGGRAIAAGESFGANYAVGWFDSIEEMERAYDRERQTVTARRPVA